MKILSEIWQTFTVPSSQVKQNAGKLTLYILQGILSQTLVKIIIFLSDLMGEMYRQIKLSSHQSLCFYAAESA